jgi:hypothetical protein
MAEMNLELGTPGSNQKESHLGYGESRRQRSTVKKEQPVSKGVSPPRDPSVIGLSPGLGEAIRERSRDGSLMDRSNNVNRDSRGRSVDMNPPTRAGVLRPIDLSRGYEPINHPNVRS